MLPQPCSHGAEYDLSVVPPPPRKLSFRSRRLLKSSPVFLLVGGIFAGVGLVLSLVFCWGLPVDLLLDLDARRITGRVEQSRVNGSVRINSRHPTEVTFTYEVDGRVYQGDSNVLGVDPAALPPGAPVELEVVPSKPEWARVVGTTYSTFGYFTLFVLVFPMIGLSLLAFALLSQRRRIRAFVYGRPGLGRVLSLELNHAVRINGRHPYKLVWEFEAEGARYEGSLSSMEREPLETLVQEGHVVVLYDPARPRVNTVYAE